MPNITLTPQQLLAVEGIDFSFRERMSNLILPSWVDKMFWHNSTSTMEVEPYVVTEGNANWRETPEGGNYELGDVKLNPILVANKRFVKALQIKYSQIQYDKYDEVMMMAESVASSTEDLWMQLVMNTINNAGTTLAYDGATFFSTAHKLGNQVNQSNLITIDISALPTSEHGTGPTAPSPAELRQSVSKVISGLRQIKRGAEDRPNEWKRQFHVMLPESFAPQAEAAFTNENLAAVLAETFVTLGATGARYSSDDRVGITYSCVPSLSLTDSFIVSVVDTPEKPFMRQTKESRIDHLDQNSDQWKKYDILEWIAKQWCGVSNFNWYRAAKGVMV